MAKYRKSIAALLGALATWGLTAAADGHYDQVELWGLLAALAAVTAVWGAANDPPFAAEPDDAGLGVMEALMFVAVVLVIIALLFWLAPHFN